MDATSVPLRMEMISRESPAHKREEAVSQQHNSINRELIRIKENLIARTRAIEISKTSKKSKGINA